HRLDAVALTLTMSVTPDSGGQQLSPAMARKIAAAKSLIGDRPIELEVDGGVTIETAPIVGKAGCNVLVAGSAIFKGASVEAYRSAISDLRSAAKAGRS
ncbi:ribulose-phosphate 3-epimerase, partial [Rhizobium sp. SEMIA 4085]|nr:ribulose-phosphate 3-epimerase [Rhizobium sp. SEMIA 4085]